MTKLHRNLLIVFVIAIFAIGCIMAVSYLSTHTTGTRAQGVFHYLGDPDAPIKSLYSFVVSSNGNVLETVLEFGTVGFTTDVKLIGKDKIDDFDKHLVRLEGRYIELPAEKNGTKRRLWTELTITLIF